MGHHFLKPADFPLARSYTFKVWNCWMFMQSCTKDWKMQGSLQFLPCSAVLCMGFEGWDYLVRKVTRHMVNGRVYFLAGTWIYLLHYNVQPAAGSATLICKGSFSETQDTNAWSWSSLSADNSFSSVFLFLIVSPSVPQLTVPLEWMLSIMLGYYWNQHIVNVVCFLLKLSTQVGLPDGL
jgi:hypothetical protein